MAKTSIEWTGRSFNPIRARNKKTGKTGWHCTHKSPGCINCYSENRNKWVGTGLDFKPSHLHTHGIELFFDDRMLMEPLRVKAPAKWFPCSMTDLFGEFVSDEWIDRMFAVMALCPQHTFQVLTKRSERMRDYLGTRAGDWMLLWPDAARKAGALLGDVATVKTASFPLPNVWLGVSAEDQRRADERIPDLLATPAAVRWVSAEPLLEEINFREIRPDATMKIDALTGRGEHLLGFSAQTRGLDWIVVGGESGPKARHFVIDHGVRIVRDCLDAGTAVFVKQLGRSPVYQENGRPGRNHRISDRKGAIMEEWPEELRVRQMPTARAQ